ncbi:MAG TPA: PKD domain-containing protein, partial [Bacteroidia bacterium]|nr:PKD domain-containing protein [Bacteroidia bacterium]
MLKIFSILFFPLSFVNAYGQQATYAASESGREAGIDFEENKGQWPAQVHFMADIHGGRVFFENGAFTYVLHSLDDLEKIHSESHEKNTPMEAGKVQCHAFQVRFEGSNSYHVPNGNDELKFHRNYFHGNDPSKWAADVRMYQGITYPEIYAGIDLRVYGNGSNLEYDYIVVPGGDPGLIREAYHGLDAGAWQLTKEGSIILQTALGNITQLKPVAYQIINGKRKEVKVAYRFQGNSPDDNTFGYHFPEGFNTQHELIIDPVLVAATYSGSTSTNYGHCATYDAQGNIYTGAISFAQGYPVTAGAFQTTFGGSVDIAISKLDPTGSALLYATYIGGMSQDYPHSLVVNTSGQLYVYGSTMSTNFPTTAGSFDQTHNGIADIIVAGLSATGNSLIGSTFVGGTANDGWNNLTYNYGDTYRGEIILDGNDNPYIASTTNSANFPVTAGSYDNTSNGAHDAVVFKLNPALTSLMWSTFLGGSQDDGANGLVLNATGDVYVCGSTQSFNFPVLPGTINSSFIGGSSDGFVFLLSNNGSAMTTSTFFGTSGNDFIFFTDLDGSGNVYVFGQSDIAINPTSGVYANPGSPQFIASMDPGLFSINFQTVFGGGNMNDRISPTAFMVDVCDHVYAAGWGDVTAYPVTSNAIQPTTDGSDFYLIVLDMNATSLIHATYFGGTGWEHVDGGTSRFDPNGIVYEAICQNATNMTTTPGAYSPNNMAGSYDIAVFKIDFQAVGVIAQASAAPSDTICLNDLAQFSNNSLNATDYIWNFGDGSPLDTNAAPSHFFLTSGTFNVMLVAMDSTSCNIADTVYLVMTVLPLPTVDLGNDTTICGTVNLVLNASSPNVTYNWSTGATTSSITATVPGTYWVVVDNGFCQATDTIQILSFQPPDIGSD